MTAPTPTSRLKSRHGDNGRTRTRIPTFSRAPLRPLPRMSATARPIDVAELVRVPSVDGRLGSRGLKKIGGRGVPTLARQRARLRLAAKRLTTVVSLLDLR